jgi:hypothetical protein
MTDIPEFIVESIDASDENWKFFNEIQRLNSKYTQTLNGGISKKFTSLATTSTIFRWDFGDGTTIETHINPYVHTYAHSGKYSVSHQSCYPCIATGTLVCSNGWCTQLIDVKKEKEQGNNSVVALAGLTGLFIIAKEDNCCKLRDRCSEKREICRSIKPEDIENIKACKNIEKTCTTRLKDCRKKCAETGHTWKPLPYTCLEKKEPHKEVCQTIERQKYVEKKKKDKNSK